MDDETNTMTHRLNDVFSIFKLKQWVTVPTHKSNHILDLVITSEMDIFNINVTDIDLSDHFLIEFKTHCEVQHVQYKEITFRNYKSVD